MKSQVLEAVETGAIDFELERQPPFHDRGGDGAAIDHGALSGDQAACQEAAVGRPRRPDGAHGLLGQDQEDATVAALPGRQVEANLYRSEERRVGKECRSRWSPD